MTARALNAPLDPAGVVREPGLPQRVTIHEVGPRDGLQYEPGVVSTATKIAFIDRLSAAGLPVVEVASFAHPDRVPQLADGADVMAGITRTPGRRYPVLVPHRWGLEQALAAGATDIAVVASASDTYARRDLDRDLDRQFELIAPVVHGARAAGAAVRGYVAMSFGDPWEGRVPRGQVLGVCRRLLDLGCDTLSLGDTLGVATPGQVTAVLTELSAAGVGLDRIGVHFHDTYGQGAANTLAALRAGVATVDASAGGLGGCPFAKSAVGNLATEDLVWLLHGLGIETGVDLGALVDTSAWLAGELGRPSPSRVVRALTA